MQFEQIFCGQLSYQASHHHNGKQEKSKSASVKTAPLKSARVKFAAFKSAR